MEQRMQLRERRIGLKENSHKFFMNTGCRYFPCHKGADRDSFNCLFCYCPLYCLGPSCGGDFTYTEKGVKDCSGCLKPHSEGGYEYVISRFRDISKIASEKIPDQK